MKKKILALVSITFLTFGLVGCGNGSDSTSSTTSSTSGGSTTGGSTSGGSTDNNETNNTETGGGAVEASEMLPF